MGLLVGTLLSGCSAAAIVVPTLLDALMGGAAIYQRYEDRQVQIQHVRALDALQAEIRTLRGIPWPTADILREARQ